MSERTPGSSVELNGPKERNDSHKNVLLSAQRGLCSHNSLQGPRRSFLGFIDKVGPVVYQPLAQPCFPTMNARELVDFIRSGPVELVLDKLPRFRRRTRSNPCDFNEFLQALQSSETIRTAVCWSHLDLDITGDEWVLLVKTLGSIRDIHNLKLYCTPGSHAFRPFQAIAEAVNNARSLCKLTVVPGGETFPRDPFGIIALANALRERTALQEFNWIDLYVQEAATQDITFDPVLRALAACPHLRMVTIMTKCASAGAMKNLLRNLHSATDLRLVLETNHWLAVADEIRLGHCLIKTLELAMRRGTSSEATEAIKALASAIQLDQNLERVTLRIEKGFTDEAGVALAEALTANKTLRQVHLSVKPVFKPVFTDVPFPNTDELGTPAYEAFGAMLRGNTSLVLELPRLHSVGGDRRLFESHCEMHIENQLNLVGRGGLLASRQTTREEWVNALHELSTYDAATHAFRSTYDVDDAFRVSCLYSLLRLNPAICMLKVDSASESCE
jgi:hypothetical protein